MNREHPRAVIRAAAFSASLALLSVGVAAPAYADAEDPVEVHCLVLVDAQAGVDAGEEFCADTFDGADRLFHEQTGLTRVESADVVGPLVTYTLATFYEDISYGGSSYSLLRSSPCDGVTLASVSNLGTVGLNDAISSFITYSGCQARLYENISYGGSTYGFTTTQSSLPTFNDRASSARAR